MIEENIIIFYNNTINMLKINIIFISNFVDILNTNYPNFG